MLTLILTPIRREIQSGDSGMSYLEVIEIKFGDRVVGVFKVDDHSWNYFKLDPKIAIGK